MLTPRERRDQLIEELEQCSEMFDAGVKTGQFQVAVGAHRAATERLAELLPLLALPDD